MKSLSFQSWAGNGVSVMNWRNAHCEVRGGSLCLEIDGKQGGSPPKMDSLNPENDGLEDDFPLPGAFLGVKYPP